MSDRVDGFELWPPVSNREEQIEPQAVLPYPNYPHIVDLVFRNQRHLFGLPAEGVFGPIVTDRNRRLKCVAQIVSNFAGFEGVNEPAALKKAVSQSKNVINQAMPEMTIGKILLAENSK